MVKIDEEYIINANESCYTLEKIGKVEDVNSKNYGKKVKTICGYYTTIERALNGYLKIKMREYIASETESSLKELLEKMESMEKFLKDKLKDI